MRLLTGLRHPAAGHASVTVTARTFFVDLVDFGLDDSATALDPLDDSFAVR